MFHTLVFILLLSVGALHQNISVAQTYPSEPIRILTTGSGGSGDVISRIVAHGVGKNFSYPVIVENRGTGVLPGIGVFRAKPDGHTLLISTNALWVTQFFQSDVPFDPLGDFSPITLVGISPQMLIVSPSLPVESLKELITLAKQKPGVLNYGTPGTASASHLAGELFKSMAGVDVARVSYKAVGQAMTDIMSGRVHLMFTSVPLGMPQWKAGKVKALAVTSLSPSALTPGLDTMAASGLPGYESAAIVGMFAPAKTPDAIIKRLNSEVVRFIASPEGKAQLLAAGLDPVGSTAEELRARIQHEVAHLGRVLKEAGIVPK